MIKIWSLKKEAGNKGEEDKKKTKVSAAQIREIQNAMDALSKDPAIVQRVDSKTFQRIEFWKVRVTKEQIDSATKGVVGLVSFQIYSSGYLSS